ncbi:DUF2484 family protein [Pseudooceanicola sp. CBS1P-1]|uniref:DUF2484 family protein n=1 Tax=Pseudooceanicola albus TaxID=2692189 RepID=A0A6L7FYH0_9RHOB|nr:MULTISPECIES: DUF2484 family protein [Pseudooceanicola]MBT9382583.1 DUF2484 family protein [Pseudooceanicola endophyticus]MXN17124.1 DUF2484 family protein [Pseudooceanicola albus]
MESFLIVLFWVVCGNAVALVPVQRHAEIGRLALIAVGIPCLGYITLQHGPWLGLAMLLLGALVLRWPLGRARRLPPEGEAAPSTHSA